MSDEERAAEIAGDCRERRERGEALDTDDVLRAHPDLAGPLRRAFAAWRRLDEAFPDARPATSRVGRTLGPYRLVAELGAGGMGTVYLAELEQPTAGVDAGAHVAVKVLHPHLLVRPDSVRRLLREAAIGRRIRHENVVRTLDAAQAEDGDERLHFVVMEYVEGRTLRALSDDLGRVPEELCRHIGREVARALVAIHAAGAVHRDLKPENVILTPEHVVKVMDLGVARFLDESLRVSQPGAFVGSIRYAAPEQFGRPVPRGATSEASSAEVDGRVDLYALGLTLYELATGGHPFAGDDFHVVLKRQLTETPRPAGEVNPQLSPFFEDLLARLVEKDRGRRIASAAELERILDEGEDSAWWRTRSAAIREATHRPLRRIRVPRETALYGREPELAKLRALFDATKAGDGRVVLVEGEAGIGKSRLVDEFVGRLAQAGEDVSFLYGSYPPGGAATASGAFTSAYREHLGDDEASIRAALPQTPLLAPAFAALLRGDVAPTGAEPLTKDSLQTVFVHATRSFAAQRPTIVLIDDLHFAPVEGRALFASLALVVPGHRILLVGGARPGLDEKWVAQLVARPQTTRLALTRLGPKELVRLLRDALKSERLAEELSALIALKSDGNPFFVFELLRGLRDGQFLRQRPDGTWETTQIIRDIQVPSSIADLVQARVADLDVEDKNLLDVAACCGFEFDPLVVAAALGVGQIPAMQRLARIEKRHRLVRSAGRRFVFDHHQVQEAIYAGMPELLREPYHAAIAEAIEARSGAASKEPKDVDGDVCIELTAHFLKGARGERAIRYLDAAIGQLEKGGLNAQAVALAERALAVQGLLAGVERARALLRLAATLDVMGRRARQEEAAREAERLAGEAGDDEVRGRANMSLGTLFWTTSRQGEAEAAYRVVLEIATMRGDRTSEAGAIVNLGHVFWYQGRRAEATGQWSRGLVLSREVGQRLYEVIATGRLGGAFRSLGRFAEAREHYERSLALSREIGLRRYEATATGNLGNLFWAIGRSAEAKEQCERGLALSREIGDRKGETSSTGNLGGMCTSLGRFAEAREHVERHLALAREIGEPSQQGNAVQFLADLAVEEGDAAEAERRIAEALDLRRAIGERNGEVLTLLAQGVLFARLSRADDARVALDAALALARELSLPSVELLATAELAALPRGDVAAALAALAAHEGGTEMREAMQARYLIWQATRDPAHLAEAKRLLDFLVEHAPPDCRESMLANVRLHREIAAAAREQGLPLAADA